MYSFSYISAERWWQQKHTFVAKLLLMGYLIQLAGISSALKTGQFSYRVADSRRKKDETTV
jgi:hypothetical protein